MADFTGAEAERYHDNGDGTFSATVAVQNVSNSSVIRSTAGAMAPGQTAKQYVGSVTTSTTASTTVTLETVTAGKTYYITDVAIFTGSTTPVDSSLQAGGVKILAIGASSTAPATLTGIETQPFATSGQVVTFVIPATASVQTVWFNFYGYEQ